MGNIGGDIFGSGQRQTATTEPDEISKALNSLRLQQLQGLFSQYPYANYAAPNPEAYTASPQVSQLLDSATSQQFDFNDLISFDDYLSLGLDQSRNYINQIATPEIMSTLALQGLEGGGAASEAIAKASAQYGLPFVQGLPQASVGLTGARNLLPQQVGLASAQRAGTLLPLADYSRSLREEDLLRQQGVVTSGLTGLPFSPGSSTKQRQSSQPLFNFFGQG